MCVPEVLNAYLNQCHHYGAGTGLTYSAMATGTVRKFHRDQRITPRDPRDLQ